MIGFLNWFYDEIDVDPLSMHVKFNVYHLYLSLMKGSIKVCNDNYLSYDIYISQVKTEVGELYMFHDAYAFTNIKDP